MSSVYANYTQEELDQAYDQSVLVPNMTEYMSAWAQTSREVRSQTPPVTLRYGQGECEMIDVYPGQLDGPVHFHIHGGAWRAMSRPDCAFVTRGLASRGATVVVAGFSLVPTVTLDELVAQVREALVFVTSHLVGASSLYVSGHSSGAHVATCLLDPDWQKTSGIPTGAIAGMVLVSGPYDLEPVRLSARNSYLKLTEQAAETLSPVRRLTPPLPPIDIMWGDGEHEEFKRQSRYLARRLPDHATATQVPGKNHFDMYADFEDPDSAIIQAALKQMHK